MPLMSLRQQRDMRLRNLHDPVRNKDGDASFTLNAPSRAQSVTSTRGN